MAEPCWQAEVCAGDALYIPAGWWHEVLTPRCTLALNFWFKPHSRASLRPTMLHLHSDAYASRALASTASTASTQRQAPTAEDTAEEDLPNEPLRKASKLCKD